MSHRPTRRKAANKMRKAMRRTPKGFIDLFQWLEDRGYADTQGQARKVILSKRVRSESHVVGIADVVFESPRGKETTRMAERFIPASMRDTLEVVSK